MAATTTTLMPSPTAKASRPSSYKPRTSPSPLLCTTAQKTTNTPTTAVAISAACSRKKSFSPSILGGVGGGVVVDAAAVDAEATALSATKRDVRGQRVSDAAAYSLPSWQRWQQDHREERRDTGFSMHGVRNKQNSSPLIALKSRLDSPSLSPKGKERSSTSQALPSSTDIKAAAHTTRRYSEKTYHSWRESKAAGNANRIGNDNRVGPLPTIVPRRAPNHQVQSLSFAGETTELKARQNPSPQAHSGLGISIAAGANATSPTANVETAMDTEDETSKARDVSENNSGRLGDHDEGTASKGGESVKKKADAHHELVQEGEQPADREPEGRRTTAPLEKQVRATNPAPKVMPLKYETCEVHDLGLLIADMLMELVRLNDGIPLKDGQLTRFHSRAPPSISFRDYLTRLIVHATLSPPLLLSMVFYIDRLCALYPAFTISSLTVHRFLITAATVAAKGLGDSFWTNSTYARVGGVSVKELALLELELLKRLKWRIVPKPEVLVDYYKSLVERSNGHILEKAAEPHRDDE